MGDGCLLKWFSKTPNSVFPGMKGERNLTGRERGETNVEANEQKNKIN